MTKIQLLLSTFFFYGMAFGQNIGTVTGIISDKDFNDQPLAYASVAIKGTSNGIMTDDNGLYQIKISEGNHTLVISYMGYQTIELPIEIKANETLKVNQSLHSDGEKIEDVVIQLSNNKQRESALLVEQQKAIGLQTNIGAQELSRKGVSDVATAVTKQAGISKQEGSGTVFVRGLGDRYNATSLNGLPIPSNDPEKKNIDLSIFNTDIVEYISIEKVYQSKMSGDFAGGNIDIISKDFKGNQLFEIQIGASANSNAIGESQFYLQDGPSVTGFSNQNIPNNPLNSYGFENSLTPQKTVPFSGSFGIKFGKSFNVGAQGRLKIFATASTENGYQFREGINQSVNAQGSRLKSFQQQKYSYQTNTTGMFSAGYDINSNHQLKYNFLMVNSSNQTMDNYRGFLRDIAENDNGFIRRGTYQETRLMVHQLLGKHQLSDRLELNWATSFNTVKSDMPDRTQNTLWFNESKGGYVFAINSTTDNHRYYQSLKEDELAANLALKYALSKNEADDTQSNVTFGYQFRQKERDFQATQFNFRIAGASSGTIINPERIDDFLNQQNFSEGKFDIETFSGNLEPQVYNGSQNIHAAFATFEHDFSKKWSASIGLRVENIEQVVSWKTQLDLVGNENVLKNEAILPHVILKYAINDKQNLRFAASKTYTLPQFKERAYFVYEDVTEVKVGNPDLYASDDYNVDVKWEMFPKTNEIVSFTLFGKLIQNPINEVTLASSTNDISYINTGDQGYVVGAEVELRKKIYQIGSDDRDQISFGFNASYMKTSQDLDSQKVRNETNYNINLTDSKAGFTGASDFLANADISWSQNFKNDSSIMATLAYAYFSNRLYALGTEMKGNLVDQSVGSLDFILKTKLNKQLGLNFSVRNLLDPRYDRVQENSGADVTVLSYKKGLGFGVGLQYSF